VPPRTRSRTATETRADLRERLHGEGLSDRVAVPEDGSEVPL
jgi:hypothetical protein